MAFGAIELTTISRAQDYSTIKQNEDNKGMIDQSNISHQVQRNAEQRTREVHTSDNADWHEKKPDAKEKGNNAYYGDGGKRRGKKADGTVRDTRVSRSGGFDMKI